MSLLYGIAIALGTVLVCLVCLTFACCALAARDAGPRPQPLYGPPHVSNPLPPSTAHEYSGPAYGAQFGSGDEVLWVPDTGDQVIQSEDVSLHTGVVQDLYWSQEAGTWCYGVKMTNGSALTATQNELLFWDHSDESNFSYVSHDDE